PCNSKAPIAEWTGEKPQPIPWLALRAADEAARRRMIRRPAVVAATGNVCRLPVIDRVGRFQIKFSSDAFCHQPITVANRNPTIRSHHFQIAVQWWRATQRYLCRDAAEQSGDHPAGVAAVPASWQPMEATLNAHQGSRRPRDGAPARTLCEASTMTRCIRGGLDPKFRIQHPKQSLSQLIGS